MATLPERPYPLQWPEGWTRTRVRQHTSRYKANFVQSRDQVLRELRLFADRTLAVSPRSSVVISSDVPTRLDGLPLANFRAPKDPGVAVWWRTRDDAVRVIACDKYTKIDDNLRAVALALAAMRALERSGASQIFERSAQNFTAGALPSSTVPRVDAQMSIAEARVVMGFSPFGPMDRRDIDARFKTLASLRHPDAPNGSHEKFLELQKARDILKVFL